MLEFTICSMLTILPDFLIRHFVQGKRIGHEITLYTVWYELRYGITSCLMLTVTLITVVFYFHPSATSVVSYFRTITILPEAGGRVAEIYVVNNQAIKAGEPIFRLDDSSQKADVTTAKARVAEIDATTAVTLTEREAAEAAIDQAQGAYEVVKADYDRQIELRDRGSSAVREAEIERLENMLSVRQGEMDAASANLHAVEEKLDVLLPAQKDSAEAMLAEAETELAKTLIVAGVDGRIEQFGLRVGDFLNPLLRPAGILVPSEAGHEFFTAGFSQTSAQVIRTGMLVEIGCQSKPFTVVPMVITGIQDVIPSGQLRPTDRLADPQDNMRPGTLTVFLEPLYEGGISDLPPGSHCLANAYTSNHDKLDNEELGSGERIFLHVVDTVGLVHAFVLRLKVLIMPVQELVFSGH